MKPGCEAQKGANSVARAVRLTLPQAIGLAGGVVLALGAFAPTLHQPVIGSLSLYNDGTNYGIVMIALAAVSLYLDVTKRVRGLWFAGLLALLLAGYSLAAVLDMLNGVGKMSSGRSAGFFENLKMSAVQDAYIQWGWLVLFGGAGLLLAAACVAQRERQRTSGTRKR